jgi:hypothetical protein
MRRRADKNNQLVSLFLAGHFVKRPPGFFGIRFERFLYLRFLTKRFAYGAGVL